MPKFYSCYRSDTGEIDRKQVFTAASLKEAVKLYIQMDLKQDMGVSVFYGMTEQDIDALLAGAEIKDDNGYTISGCPCDIFNLKGWEIFDGFGGSYYIIPIASYEHAFKKLSSKTKLGRLHK